MDVLKLLDDMEGFVAWQEEVGPEEVNRQLQDACREHMRKHGVRSILDIGEKMDNLAARLEEFTR